MQKILVNLANDCDGNQFYYNNDLPAIGNNNYALQKRFETDFFKVIDNAKLRPSFVILLISPRQPIMLWPKAPDFAL